MYTQPDIDAQYAVSYDIFGDAMGWLALSQYRATVDTELATALTAAGYPALGFSTLGTSTSWGNMACSSSGNLRLQPERPWGFATMDSPPVSVTGESWLAANGKLTVTSGESDLLADADINRAGAHPHYWSGAIHAWTGPASHEAAAARRDTSVDYPTGTTHWNATDNVTASSAMYTSFSCPTPASTLFAPDIEYLTPGYLSSADRNTAVWTSNGFQTWNGQAVSQSGATVSVPSTIDAPFHSEAIGNECEVLDSVYGTGNCFESTVLADRLAAISGPGGTMVQTAVAAHNTRASGTVPVVAGPVSTTTRPAGHGTYQIDQENLALQGSDRPNRTYRSNFGRRSSGDLDSQGRLIVYDARQSRRSTTYQVQAAWAGLIGSMSVGLETGVPEFDGLPLASAPRLTLWDHYFGFGPGTCANQPTCHADADEEYLIREGPFQFRGAIDWVKSPRYGSCTLCAEFGCSGADQDFTNDRFSGPVRGHALATAGEPPMVCLIESGAHRPPLDCPGPS